MSTDQPQKRGTKPGTGTAKLRGEIHEIEPLLDLSGEWEVRDLECDKDNSINSLLLKLHRAGHVEQVDKNYTDNGVIWTYRWVQQSKQEFQDYLDQLNLLPCGHRAHIPPSSGPDDTDKLPCKFCGDLHDKETIKARL